MSFDRAVLERHHERGIARGLGVHHVLDRLALLLEAQQADGSWRMVNQSVHGNDYWQTDYDPTTSTWEITYTLAADNPGDARRARAFRFRVEP